VASPQTENGFTKFSNEIVEALFSHRLSGQEYQIVLFIIRKTYGFGKKHDFISMGQISEGTGICRPLVARILKNLYSKNIIGVTQNVNSSVNCLYFQKDYERWKVLPKKITVTQNVNTTVTQNVNEGVTQNVTHKRKKETIKEIVLPEWLPKKEWESFVTMRKKIRAPMTDHAKELAIKTLNTLKAQGEDPKAVIEQSIENSYRGLFPVKKQGQTNKAAKCAYGDKVCYFDCPKCDLAKKGAR
jgi:phage replication O-like protein O